MRSSFIPVVLCAALVGCATSGPEAYSRVFDMEEVLDVRMEDRLDSLFGAHESRTGNEIVLVTHSSFNGRSPMEFTVAFGDSLCVGKKERNNGVTIAFSKDRREVFIATGYGTEHVLHDSICQRIIDREMLPRFKLADASGGLWAGCLAVVEFLDRPENRIH